MAGLDGGHASIHAVVVRGHSISTKMGGNAMEPISIGAATLVAKWVLEGVGKAAAEKSLGGLKKIYDFVRAKLSTDKTSSEVLDRLEQKPGSQARALELAELLDERVKSDPSFAAELRQAVAEAEKSPASSSFVTQVMDNAKVGKITNIGVVQGDVHI
jgi:hypothetical protein